MNPSSTISLSQYKSPWRCLARSFFLSRRRWRAIAKQERLSVEQLRQQLDVAERENQRLERQVDDLGRQLDNLSNHQPTSVAAVELPRWDKLPGHQFSAELISLACQLSSCVGFRAVPKVFACLNQALGFSLPALTRDAVRNWSCRNGAAILQQNPRADDWVWMIDHSVQLGKMFVLVVLGIRSSAMPVGRALRRDDMTPLAVLPSTSRDKAEVSRQLTELAGHCGTPLAVLSDGAAELHHGALALKNLGFSGVHLDDIKHKVSNLLKKHLKDDERFQAFVTHLGQTTASIQQTELDHLLPPRSKQKCRFMNFDRIIDWATMAQQQLAKSQLTVSPEAERLTTKLGWLNNFSDDLLAWHECRTLVGKVLAYANQEGVFKGATAALGTQLAACRPKSELAQEMQKTMISFYQDNEDRLAKLPRPSIRLPCSTEVLESAFGSFKARQGDHGRGTFTSLLATFGALFDRVTPQKIRQRFTRFKNRDLKQWLKDAGLTNSTQSRRTKAYEKTKKRVTESKH